ncbi:MAG TPA: prolyl oligopeptidase family serine peptidase [Acidimicrobiia bacterium]|nr:prolyl oligopeptidase family serine peptidase [Acidimicrobiia bacterium]
MTRRLPFGSWPSPISAESTTRAAVRFLDAIQVDGEDVYWVEGRPAERGRSAIVRRGAAGTIDDVGPEDFDARTRVHEYGGGAYAVQHGTVFAARFGDQRWYRIDPEGEAAAVTPPPAAPAADRYADPALGDGWAIAVGETHHADGVDNHLARLDLSGADPPRVVASGHDFYAAPRLSPDRTRLAWLTWDHPDMPWDSSTLWVAPIDTDGVLGKPERVAGGAGESVLQPEWSNAGVLHFASDRTGWWNLYRWTERGDEPVHPMEAECAAPHWIFGSRRYALLDDGRIALLTITPHGDRLVVIAGDEARTVPTPFLAFHDRIAAMGNRVVVVGTAPDRPTTVAAIDVDSGAIEILRPGDGPDIDPAFHSTPERIEFPTPDGPAYAWFYPPAHPECRGPDGSAPPALVTIHGGPSSSSVPRLDPEILFWTSRGIAVLDVDHGGSTMAGRDFRRRLDGMWGVVDVRDCALAARHVAATRLADSGALLIRGGSAGGFTTLLALALHDDFAAGTAYYGVTDLEALATDTHKFESRYLDRLVGPYPERRDLYVDRSPITHVASIRVPVLLLQGLDDQVVPPAQARSMRDALIANGTPVGYLEFPGEGHGFRAAATRTRALEAELAFYAAVLGFEPHDHLEPVPLVTA